MICDKCGHDSRDGALVCEQCGAPLPVSAGSSSSGSSRSFDDAPVNGYMSYTYGGSGSSRSSRSPYSEPVSSEKKPSSNEWVAYASIICGALAIYSCVTVVPGVLLGISAIIFGLVGIKTPKKTIAIIGLAAGIAGIIISILIAFAIAGLFGLLATFLTGGYGFRTFGW